jgi:MFS family permease
MNRRILFWASNMALIATAMSFAIRGDIMTDFESEFVQPYVDAQHESGAAAARPEWVNTILGISEETDLVKQNLGIIAGIAFLSFGLAILFGGPLVDLLGMGNLLRLAAACHIGGVLLTIFAPSFWVVVFATFVVGAGNGLVEAVCNPLIATLYPEEKTHKLTLFHAWFPGGIVIGGVLAWLLSEGRVVDMSSEVGWKVKMALILVPAVVYTFMMIGQKFPPTERVASGVRFSEMFSEALRRPLFYILFVVMWLTAATELGTGQWIANIYNDVLGGREGILALVWGSILMYVLRQFFSKPIHAFLTPVALMMVTAPIAALGLFLFYYANSPAMFFLAATLVYVGVCFWWPTMLGITSERCPRTGALGLAIIGGVGSFSTSIAGPIIGRINDNFGAARALQIWAILPVFITVVFVLVYLSDKAKGGYQKERLESLNKAEAVE